MNLLDHSGRLLGFRPEAFLPSAVVGDEPGQLALDFHVVRVENLGSDRYVYGTVPAIDPEARVIAKLPSTVVTSVEAGTVVPFAVAGKNLRLFDAASGQRAAEERVP